MSQGKKSIESCTLLGRAGLFFTHQFQNGCEAAVIHGKVGEEGGVPNKYLDFFLWNP